MSFILLSCNNDAPVIEVNKSDSHYNVFQNNVSPNLFSRIILENEKAMGKNSNNRLKNWQNGDITSFSELFSKMNILEINILNVIDSIIDFKLNTGPIYIDGTNIDFNQINYSISKINNTYTLSNDLNISYQIRKNNNDYLLDYNGSSINFNGGDFSQVNGDVFKRSQVDVMIMREYTEDIPTNYIPTIYVGSAWGFHTDLATANLLCQKGFDKILNDHPTWCSGGISYSCIFDQHFCTCSANFFEGEECD